MRRQVREWRASEQRWLALGGRGSRSDGPRLAPIEIRGREIRREKKYERGDARLVAPSTARSMLGSGASGLPRGWLAGPREALRVDTPTNSILSVYGGLLSM